MRRVPARYPPRTWNLHMQVLHDDARTNNHCEGWNNKFRSLVGHKHPTVWSLIKSLQMEQATTETVVAQIRVGAAPTGRRVKQVFIQQQERLSNLCRQYNTGERTLPEFLRAAANTIRF